VEGVSVTITVTGTAGTRSASLMNQEGLYPKIE